MLSRGHVIRFLDFQKFFIFILININKFNMGAIATCLNHITQNYRSHCDNVMVHSK